VTQTDTTGTTTYTWDAQNRLAAITGPTTTASFSYDALGRRVSKTINGVTTTSQYDGLDALRESGGTGEASYLRTLAIDEALSRTDNVGTTAYLADLLGSTLALTDATGTPVTTYTYAPFGETSVSGPPSGSPSQFTGRENDGTGLYYYRARYYDPVRSRFVSEDPVGLADGLNSYRYARNAPLRFRDPVGLLTVVGGFGGSAVAGKGVEASVGGYYTLESGEAGGFVSVGGAAGLNVSGDVFGGLVWGELQGVTTNTNIVIGLVSVTLMVDVASGQLIGGTVGVGPWIPGIPLYGLSQSISATGTLCLANCAPLPTVHVGCRK
jgi:RHS repeat-associated protein